MRDLFEQLVSWQKQYRTVQLCSTADNRWQLHVSTMSWHGDFRHGDDQLNLRLLTEPKDSPEEAIWAAQCVLQRKDPSKDNNE